MFTKDRVVAMAPIQWAGESGTIDVESPFPWASSSIPPTAVIPGAYFGQWALWIDKAGTMMFSERTVSKIRDGHEKTHTQTQNRAVGVSPSSRIVIISSRTKLTRNGIRDRHQRRMQRRRHPPYNLVPGKASERKRREERDPAVAGVVGVSESEEGARRDARHCRVLHEGGALFFVRLHPHLFVREHDRRDRVRRRRLRRRGAEGGDHVGVPPHAVVCDEHVLDGVVLEVDLVHSLLLRGLGSDAKYEFRDVGTEKRRRGGRESRRQVGVPDDCDPVRGGYHLVRHGLRDVPPVGGGEVDDDAPGLHDVEHLLGYEHGRLATGDEGRGDDDVDVGGLLEHQTGLRCLVLVGHFLHYNYAEE